MLRGAAPLELEVVATEESEKGFRRTARGNDLSKIARTRQHREEEFQAGFFSEIFSGKDARFWTEFLR
jgi:hypothetical protein